jgi:hypothetical protein
MNDLKQNDKSTWSWNVMRLQRGPLTDNGATPWYTVLRMGSERQELKFAIDTGTTHSWVTSIQCTTQACLNHRRFDFRSSTSFKQLTSPYSPDEISFGPWGTMQVTLGSDRVEFTKPETENICDIDDYRLYVSQYYNGQQFRDLTWEGAIGVPTRVPEQVDSSELFTTLMRTHPFPSDQRALCFNYAAQVLQFIDLNMKRKAKDFVTAELLDSAVLPGAWVVKLGPVDVNRVTVHESVQFCLDTGSSRFKGDPLIIEPIVRAITRDGNLPTYVAAENPDFSAYPDLVLTLHGVPIRVTPKQYFEKIANDFYKLGFHDMKGLDGILLAGSTFLEHHAPVFFFDDDLVGVGVGLFDDRRGRS